MKNLFTILAAILLTTIALLPRQAIAQSPEKMKYQAVARDNAGNILANQLISFRISILQGSSTGVSVYSETHQVSTNDFGLANLNIGNGSIVSGDFTSIAWSADLQFLKVEMDPAGGSAFQLMGTSQLLSVPYALHAKTADNITGNNSNSWNISGNAGTDPATNFIGTTDNQPLIFKVNNVQAGKIDPDLSNSFYGLEAGTSNTTGQSNTANGYRALYLNADGFGNVANGFEALYSNTEGFGNVANGYHALYFNTTGYLNTANGLEALYSNTEGYENLANGVEALYNNTTGHENTATGSYALGVNTTGNSSTANGFKALFFNTEGNNNTANGFKALFLNTTGYYNTANGSESLYSNTTGNYNTANGNLSLYSNTTGYYNTANGYQALYSNTTGYYNTANGNYSLFSNTSGSRNTANGYDALRYNTEGFQNTAVGFQTLIFNTTGANRTALGNHANTTGSTYNNNTALGAYTDCTASNQVRIGSWEVSSIGGYSNWSNISDLRFKNNIKEDVEGLSFIQKLRTVTYNINLHAIDDFFAEHYNERDSSNYEGKYDREQIRYTGFIAQEVEEAARELGYDFSGVDKPKNEDDFYGLRYAEFVVPLVKGMQEQQELIEELSNENKQMKDELAQIKLLLNKITKK